MSEIGKNARDESGRIQSGSEPELLNVFHSADSRGVFSKPFSFALERVPFEIRELFWTVSAKGTIRGMHIQTAPAASAKLVWVSAGSIHDVLIDLRSGASFGRVSSYELDADSGTALYVPTGFAHGFQALSDATIVNYATSYEYTPEFDTGVNAHSFGYRWPLSDWSGSDRDAALVELDRWRESNRGVN